MDLDQQINNINFVIPTNDSNVLHAAVSSGINKVTVFPSTANKKNIGKTQGGTTSTPVVQILSPHSWLFDKHARQLINESVGTFRSLQTAVYDHIQACSNGGENPDLTPTLIKRSREYRSMLQACVCSINSSLDNEDPDSENYQKMATQCQLLYKMELLLGLVEIIFVDGRPGSLILSQLVCWVRLHYTNCTEQMATLMKQDNPPDHPHYWQAIYGLTCQGRLSEARQLLQQHSHAHTDSFLAMDELLRKMPTYQVYSGVMESEFMVRWHHWQTECENRLQGGIFATYGHLKKLAEVLCGNIPTILSISELLGEGAWVPHMVATLLYTAPNIKLHRLHSAALTAISDCRASLSALDELMLACMEGDALQVVRGSQQALDNMWLSAHLSDLLLHSLTAASSGQHTEQHQSLAAMRDTIVQDYALELADHSSLWQVGLVYLDYCGEDGEQSPYIPMILERVPVTSDAKAHKVISLAMQRNLPNVVSSVSRVMGRRAAQENRLAAAIWWGVRAKDSHFTSHVAHQVLHRYLSSGEFQSSALLLDHLGPSMLVSDTLTFLGKYREFHTLCQKKDYKQAASLLVTLISSKLAPQYFWPVLLLDALPLLQHQQPQSCSTVVTSSQTYELLYCLSSVMELHRDNTLKTTSAGGLMKMFLQKEGEIRECLAHNLAQAIVAEGTTDNFSISARG